MTSNPERGERIPLADADVRYFGDSFRERQSIKRRRRRWANRFRREPRPIQQAVLADLKSIFAGQPPSP